MTPLRLTLLALIFIFFFSGLPMHYGLLPDALTFVPELLILGLLAVAIIKRGGGRVFKIGGWPFAVAVGIVAHSAMSTIVNNGSWLECTLFLRLLLRFYVMFLALVNIGMSEKQLRWLVGVLAVCLFVQVPVAAVRLLWEGQGERAIGAYAYRGGGLSTILPMMMTGVLLTYYIAFRRSKWFLIGILAFVAFGIIGGKRATFLMVPFAGVFAFALAGRFDVTGRRLSFKTAFLVVIGSVLVIYLAPQMIPTLNPEREFWGSFDLEYILEYSRDYDTNVTEDGRTTGRTSTNLRALEVTAGDPFLALAGKGPGSLMKSRFEGVGLERTGSGLHSWAGGIEEMGILYGLTGFSSLLLQLGYPGMLLWLSFYLYILFAMRKMARAERDPFWRAFYLSCACWSLIFLFLSVTYTAAPVQGALGTFLFFLALSMAYIHRNNARSGRRVVFVRSSVAP